MANYKHILTDFKDLRKVIGEITKEQPAKSRYQQQAEKMKYRAEAEPKDDKDGEANKNPDHAGEEEIKKAYLALGKSAKGSVEFQRGLVQKQLAKMGYKTYSKQAFSDLFNVEVESNDLDESFEEAMAKSRYQQQAEKMKYTSEESKYIKVARDVVKKKSAKKVDGVLLDLFTASAIIQVYDAVNSKNKKRMDGLKLTQLADIAFKLASKSRKEMKEGDDYALWNPTTKKSMGKVKTVQVTHKTSGKEIIIIDKPNIRKEYEKIGYYAEEVGLEEWKLGDGRPRGASHIENIRFWDLPKDHLEYIKKDSNKAIKANPKNPKNTRGKGNYADQINDADTVLAWRKKKGIKEEVGLEESISHNRLNTIQRDSVKAISGAANDAGSKNKAAVTQSSKEMEKGTRAFQMHFNSQNSDVQEVIAKAVNKVMKKSEMFALWDAKFSKLISGFGEEISEGRMKDLSINIAHVYKQMKKDSVMKPFADKFKADAMKTYDIYKSLEKVLPDYVSGGKITALMKGVKEDGSMTTEASKAAKMMTKDLLDAASRVAKGASADAEVSKVARKYGVDVEKVKQAILLYQKLNKEENVIPSRSKQVKEEHEHAKQSPFKLKSQQYPRAVAVETDGYGKRHATVDDIISACDSFGMIIDKELQVEQIQKQLGKKGFITYKKSELEDVFEERETQRMILALESELEEQSPIEYTKNQVQYALDEGHDIEFLKPNGQKTVGPVLKLSGNTFNVKDKYTGKSFTYKYSKIEEEKVKTFNEVSTQVDEGREKGPRQLTNPNKEVMVVKKNKVIVISKKDQDKYLKQGWTLAEGSLKEVSKYLKYSDLLVKKAREVEKSGPNSPAVKAINKEIDKEQKKLGIKEDANLGSKKDAMNTWLPEGDKEAYQKFFDKVLKKFGVSSPDELEGEKKKEFFDYIDKNWKADHEEVDIHKTYKVDGRRANFREKMKKLGYIKSRF